MSNNDVLEQKAGEWRERNMIPSPDNGCLVIPTGQMPMYLASFAREIVEECAKIVCEFCADSTHKQYPLIVCKARPIWEAFGRKDSHDKES